MDTPRPARYRMEWARWGLRGFYLLFAVAVVIIVGFAMFPQLGSIAGPVGAVIWGCAMLCILISCGYFVRYLIARRKESHLLPYPAIRQQTMLDRDWRPPRLGWKRTSIALVVLVFLFSLPSLLHSIFDRFGSVVGGLALLLLISLALITVLARPGRPTAP